MMDEYYKLACEATSAGMQAGPGGPFGATLTDAEGNVIVAVGNTVGRDMDWSGHAEIVAVREACKKLNTLDLSGYIMYATCEPCPMCVACMMWAQIDTCYYASTRADAADHGFSDAHVRAYFDGDKSLFKTIHVEGREDCAAIWDEFEELKAARA